MFVVGFVFVWELLGINSNFITDSLNILFIVLKTTNEKNNCFLFLNCRNDFFICRDSDGVGIYGPWTTGGKTPENRGRLLCAGAVLGVCRLCHSAALSVGRVTFAEKLYGFITFFLPD